MLHGLNAAKVRLEEWKKEGNRRVKVWYGRSAEEVSRDMSGQKNARKKGEFNTFI